MITLDYDTGLKRATISGDVDIVKELTEHFSYENLGAKFARKMGRFIPERSYLITPTGRYDEGLTYLLAEYIEKEFSGTEITITPVLQSVLTPKIKDAVSANLNLELRDYQKDIVDLCIEKGRGTVLLATAGGKTLTFANLLQSIYNVSNKETWKVLLLVPDLGLVNQTYGDFQKYGVTFRFCKWTGTNEIDLGANVIIANLGILQSKNSDTDWVKFVDLLIIDEVHKLRRDNKINKLIKTIKTHRKFGFTGTLPEANCDQWNIIGKIGPVLFEKRSFELRQDNYITNAEAKIFNIQYNNPPRYKKEDLEDPSAWFRMEQDFLVENTFRNEFISKFCGGLNNNVLVLVDLIKHGEKIYSTVKTLCPSKEVFFIRGEVEVEDREKAKQIMEKQSNVICIAISKIFSTGISINNIHYIIFAGGGKAKVKILQSIGRGLRLHENKNKLVIIDIADQLKYSGAHSIKRLDLYKSERIIFQEYTFKEKV